MTHAMKEWRNDDCETSWISRNPMKGADWPVWFILRCEYMDQHFNEREMERDNIGKYCISIIAVAPDAVSPENMQSAFRCIGMESELTTASNELKIEALASHGIYATLHQETTNNKAAGLKAARQQLKGFASIMFGFAMGRNQNRIGNDGWDFIRGEIGFKQTA